MNIDNVPAFLKDFAISYDSEKPITIGLFRLKAGQSLKYTYTYHEMKFIVDGSFIIEDETGQKVTASLEIFFIFQKALQLIFLRPILVWASFAASEVRAKLKKFWKKFVAESALINAETRGLTLLKILAKIR